MTNLLEIQGLRKNIGNFSLKDVSFSLPAGFIMGFIGPNGAGKTTTIKLILNMLRRDAGSIRLFGLDNRESETTIKEKIGVVMDQPFYVEEWSLWDVEAAVRPFYGNWNHDVYKQMLDRFNLRPEKAVKDLSRGMKMKLMMAVALSHDAKLLILDEPTSGLDPVARDELMDLLTTYIQQEDRGVLFSTHITSDLEKIADYITFIHTGGLLYTGPKDDLMESYCLVKGGPGDLTASLKDKIIDCRTYSTGFEGLLQRKDVGFLPSSVLCEPASLDDIIVHMTKGGIRHA